MHNRYATAGTQIVFEIEVLVGYCFISDVTWRTGVKYQLNQSTYLFNILNKVFSLRVTFIILKHRFMLVMFVCSWVYWACVRPIYSLLCTRYFGVLGFLVMALGVYILEVCICVVFIFAVKPSGVFLRLCINLSCGVVKLVTIHELKCYRHSYIHYNFLWRILLRFWKYWLSNDIPELHPKFVCCEDCPSWEQLATCQMCLIFNPGHSSPRILHRLSICRYVYIHVSLIAQSYSRKLAKKTMRILFEVWYMLMTRRTNQTG